ncbi:MAG TPA: hypothetical protein PLI09_11620 [Candidatus Hydrogenedentes bacterium]|nr:hypothetical protein [Candidatus Hydrogenedentota bacterium]
MNTNGFAWGYGTIGQSDDMGGYVYGIQHAPRLVRYKEEWAGVSLPRCYDPLTPWSYRCRGQIQFHALVREGQQAIHRMKNESEKPERDMAVKPQLSAFYTSYPNPALAALGHTLFLETKALSGEFAKAIMTAAGPKVAERYPHCKPEARETTWWQIASALGNRAILEETGRYEGLHYVEHYRLFQASQCALKFTYLKDVIEAAVLYGDVLPSTDFLAIHPMTRQILKILTMRSRHYFCVLPKTELDGFLPLFSAWAVDLMDAMVPMLPPKDPEEAKRVRQAAKGSPTQFPGAGPEYCYGSMDQEDEKTASMEIPPWEQPQPPILSSNNNTNNALQDLITALNASETNEEGASNDEAKKHQEMEKVVSDLQHAALEASGQTSEWEDLREDLLEQQLAASGFSQGPMEGSPTEGQTVEFSLNGEEVGGQLKDRPMELCEDPERVGKLHRESMPIAEALRKNLYPSEEERPQIERLHTSGHLDGKRLPLVETRKAVFRRYRILKEPTPKGKAVLLIAADGSASLSNEQMKMCKLLAAGWLQSAHRANVQLLAALYHSQDEFCTMGSPLVQWIYHPRKTPVSNPAEAIRAVASLPDNGTGAQSDALSLKYMLDEAVALARGSQIYLILISDCAWNKCFHTNNKTAEEEVAGVLGLFKNDLKERLHITLAALQSIKQEHIEGVIDKRIVIDAQAMSQPNEVAKSIGGYVASCIHERRRLTRCRN